MPATSPADRLRELRLAAGYAKREPCARAIGINPNTMAQHELGLREISRRRAEQYAAFFGVSPAFVLFGEPAGSGRATRRRSAAAGG